MALVMLKIGHLAIFYMLVLNVIAHVIDTTPLCGTIDGSIRPKASDMIHFKDQNQNIRTVEINGTIVACYPDDDDNKAIGNVHPLNRADVSRCANQSQTFCETDQNYPEELIKRLVLKDITKFRASFFSDSIVSDDVLPRIGDQNEARICESIQRVIYPSTAKRNDGTDAFIVNTLDFKQGVRVVECLQDGFNCSISEFIPCKLRAICQQQYVYRELLSTDANNREIIKESFKFPACCSCALYSN